MDIWCLAEIKNEIYRRWHFEYDVRDFRNICKFYKDGNVPRYFIPKLNLLEEYSKEIKKAFVEKLKAQANLQSLPFSIC